MRRLIAIACFAWPTFVTAQAPSLPRVPMDSGQGIRVLMHGGGQLQGELVRQTADSLALRHAVGEGSADTAVALAEIASVESRVRRNTLGSALKGLGIGFVSGVVAGGLVAYMGLHNCKGDLCGLAIVYVPIGTVVGGFIGLVIGSARTTEGWEVVWRPDMEGR